MRACQRQARSTRRKDAPWSRRSCSNKPPDDPDAFERYYAETHTALATAIPGLERFEAAQGIATPDGGAVPYQRIAELTFADMEALQAGLGSEQGQAAVNDIANFATGGVTIFFAEID